MKYLMVLVFILVYLFFGKELGYSETSPLYTHFTYMLQHASILHLALNSLAFIGVVRMTSKLISQKEFLPYAFIIGFSLSFLTEQNLPTVGASGLIYTIIGMYVGATAFGKHFQISEPKKYALFMTTITVALTISSINPRGNHLLHALSFLSGIVYFILFNLRNLNSNETNQL